MEDCLVSRHPKPGSASEACASKALLRRAGTSSMAVKDCGDGSYTTAVVSSKASILTLSASINGEMVGLPITVAVEPRQLAALVPCSALRLHCVAGAALQLFNLIVQNLSPIAAPAGGHGALQRLANALRRRCGSKNLVKNVKLRN